MSRVAQIRSAIRDRPWHWLLYLLAAIWVAVVYRVGLQGTLLAFVVIALFSRLVMPWLGRRHPRVKLSEIGTIEMEIAAGSASRFPIRVFLGTCLAFLVLHLILFCHEALTLIGSNFQGVGQDSDLPFFLSQAFIWAGCGSSMYTTYRNQWRRLLVTDQGMFQVFDTKRLWPTDRPLNEPDSPLRAVRLFSWDQVARFHWSRQSGQSVLHLNVHQPAISVPQLVSFPLRAFSEEDQQRLDRLLQTHVSGAIPQASGRTLTMAAAV